ncbi:MAG: hypothetical protein K1X56_00460 [Flavobacteriales bacterium]|nr:hypothetical protein [Flavobacteriales bacterium]
MSDKSQLESKGWVWKTAVFSKEEIAQIRKWAEEAKKKNPMGDLLQDDNLWKVLTDDRVLNLVKELVGPNPVYFGDSNISFDVSDNGFHKDNVDRFNPTGGDWKGQYTIVRMGIYLQDHFEHSGGLTLRENSHTKPGNDHGKIINVRTKEGDLLAWYLTTTHSANAHVMKMAPNWHLHPRIARRIPGFLLQPKIRPRIALFFSFAANDEHLKRFITYLETREYAVNRWRNSYYAPEKIEAAKAKGLTILDMHEASKSMDLSKVSKEHVEMK